MQAIGTRNLGNVYKTRGDLDRAEAMYKKALAINEDLGRKEGMAGSYGNLGLVYAARGNLDRAEAMFNKALALYRDLGSPDARRVQGWLDDLKKTAEK